jgi:hypothetical protein
MAFAEAMIRLAAKPLPATHHHVDAAVGVSKNVVKVTRHHPRRQASGGHFPSRTDHLRRRQQTTLYVAGHLQLAPSELLRHQLFEL